MVGNNRRRVLIGSRSGKGQAARATSREMGGGWVLFTVRCPDPTCLGAPPPELPQSHHSIGPRLATKKHLQHCIRYCVRSTYKNMYMYTIPSFIIAARLLSSVLLSSFIIIKDVTLRIHRDASSHTVACGGGMLWWWGVKGKGGRLVQW